MEPPAATGYRDGILREFVRQINRNPLVFRGGGEFVGNIPGICVTNPAGPRIYMWAGTSDTKPETKMSKWFQASVNAYGQSVVINKMVPVTRKGRIVATFAKCDDAAANAAATDAANSDTLEEVVAKVRASGLAANIHTI